MPAEATDPLRNEILKAFGVPASLLNGEEGTAYAGFTHELEIYRERMERQRARVAGHLSKRLTRYIRQRFGPTREELLFVGAPNQRVVRMVPVAVEFTFGDGVQ